MRDSEWQIRRLSDLKEILINPGSLFSQIVEFEWGWKN